MVRQEFFTLREMQEIYVLEHEAHAAGGDVRRHVPGGAPDIV